ncbi:MAG: Zn-ribbon domain-containing OB-fold protein [Solirubrobacteraceae bacterium]
MTKVTERRIDDGLAAAPVFELEGDLVRLLGSICTLCRATAFPARVVCVRCGGPHEQLRLRGAGRIHSWTRLANPPQGFDEAQAYACVDLEEGPRVLALLGGGPAAFGAPVQAVPAAARNGASGFRFEVADA